MILADTNILVASVVESHPAHFSALDVLNGNDVTIALHSLSELYNTLTKSRGYAWAAADAVTIVDNFAISFEIATLDTADYIEALRKFAAIGGVGARLYDYLIGSVAIIERIETIATLNVDDMKPLFPTLNVLTPAEVIERN